MRRTLVTFEAISGKYDLFQSILQHFLEKYPKIIILTEKVLLYFLQCEESPLSARAESIQDDLDSGARKIGFRKIRIREETVHAAKSVENDTKHATSMFWFSRHAMLYSKVEN